MMPLILRILFFLKTRTKLSAQFLSRDDLWPLFRKLKAKYSRHTLSLGLDRDKTCAFQIDHTGDQSWLLLRKKVK